MTVDFGAAAEVAILGTGDPVILGDGAQAVEVFGDGIVYLSRVDVVNGSGDGLACQGEAVWLDDAAVRNNAGVGLDISGGCRAHLRRSVVASNSGGGIDVSGGELNILNSAVAGNVGSSAGPGIRATSSTLGITYSTIAENGTFASPDNLECLSGSSGSVANSIVVGPGGDSVVGCSALEWTTNAVDGSGLGGGNVDVGNLDGTWFSPAANDYHLTASGEAVFMDIAQWTKGDPLTDIDGDAIPQDMPSFPGYDQP